MVIFVLRNIKLQPSVKTELKEEKLEAVSASVHPSPLMSTI